jgi:hypothetical protein
MCLAPQPDFRRVFENVRAMQQLEMATWWCSTTENLPWLRHEKKGPEEIPGLCHFG